MAENDKSAIIDLGFDYDPRKIEQFVKDMNSAKEDMKGVAENVEKMGGALDKIGGFLKGTLKGAGAFLGTITGLDQIKEQEEVFLNLKHQFGDYSEYAIGRIRKLKEEIGEGFNDTARWITGVSEAISNVGLSDKRRFEIAANITETGKKLAASIGKDKNEVIDILTSALSGGNVDEIAKLSKTWSKPQQLLLDQIRTTSLSENLDAAQVNRMSSLINSLFASTRKAPLKETVTTNLDRVQGNLEDFVDNIAKNLVPFTKKFTGALAEATEHLDKLEKPLAALTKILAPLLALSVGSKAAKLAGLGGIAGFLKKLGSVSAVGAASYLGTRGIIGLLKDKFGVDIDEKTAGFLEPLFKQIDKVKDPSQNQTIQGGSLLQGTKSNYGKQSLNQTNNINVNVSGAGDPKKVAEMVNMEIKKVFEVEIPGQTSVKAG